MKLRYYIFDWWQQRLSRQIILPTAFTTMVFLAVLGFVAFRVGQNTIEEQVNIRNLEVARLIAGDVNRFFQITLDITRLQEAQLLDQTKPAEQVRAMQALRRVFPGTYTKLRLLDREGNLMLSMQDSNEPRQTFDVDRYDPPRPIALEPSIVRGLESNRITVSQADFRPITNWPYITVTLPLATPLARTGGALVSEIDLRTFWSRVDSLDIEGSEAFIIDSRGIILAHPDRQRVGQMIDTTNVSPVFQGFEGSTTYERDGEEYIVAFSPISSVVDWAVLVEQRSSIAFAPVRTTALVAITATILSALCVAAIVSSLVQISLRPIEELSEISSRIASTGDLSDESLAPTREIATHGGATEIGTLATSFDSMVSSLRAAQEDLLQWNEQLEQRVEERTAELHTVLDIARLSGASLRQADVMQTLLQQIERLVEYDSAVILLLDSTGTALDFFAAADLVEQQPRSTRIPVDKYPLNVLVLERKAPVLVQDTRLEPLWRDTGDYALSWLGAPLVVQDKAIGVLALLKQEADFYTYEHANLLTALASHVAVMLAHARLYEDSVQRMERELREAEQIQQHLFPPPPQVAGLQVAAYFRPARETTGDFYEFISHVDPYKNGNVLTKQGEPSTYATLDLGPSEMVVVLGDVSGKSLPAALLMAMARTAIRSAARAMPHYIEGVMELSNATLVGELPRGSFVAATYALFDREELTLHLINAAQPAPLLLREGVVQELAGSGGHLPLGIVYNPTYQSQRIPLHVGDTIIFYTDGLVEAHNQRRELLGFERLTAAIKQAYAATNSQTAQHMLDHLLAVVADWTGTAPQSDDIAIVVVQVVPEMLPSPNNHHPTHATLPAVAVQ